VSGEHNRPVQYFSDEYLAQCRGATPRQILEFLESYRVLHAPQDKTKLISLKISESLLKAFRQKCELQGVKYQTQIKTLMARWLSE
jgi:predicted DNA binding CopG/RHH family protein